MKYEILKTGGKEKHGKSGTRIYRAWCNMKGRCYRKSAKRYERYGGRGIKVCEEWKNSFINFYNWAINNGYSDELTLDRINVNGNYEPANCRWISNLKQQANRSNNRLLTYNGETKAICEFAREYNMNWKTLQKRLNSGWSTEKALITPILKREDRRGIYDKRSKKVVQKDLSGNTIKIWNSIMDIKRELGYAIASISAVCNHKPKYNTAYGYRWEFYNEL